MMLRLVLLLVLVGCPASTTPNVQPIPAPGSEHPFVLGGQAGQKGWMYYDGCNTTTCVGNSCTSTLMNCPVIEDWVVDRMPPCTDKPLKKGESCSFEVKP